MNTDSEIIDALPDAAMRINARGHVDAANLAMRNALEFNPEGLSANAVVRMASFNDALTSVRNSGQATTIDLDIHTIPPRQFSAHIACIGQTGSLLVLFRDLSREQAIEKMRSDFVANASHEMRTPLTSIMMAIETLQGAAKNDPQARASFLDGMLHQARRMKRLVDDLLTLSRIELNEHVRPNTKVSLTGIAKQARSNLSSLAREMDIEVGMADVDDVFVLGDSDELLQVAQNLLENAIKYGHLGKKVDLTCGADERYARLSVRDYGAGIADVHLPRLTERFYRVNTKDSREKGGTGLGLAIVKHIVSRHRGRLDIRSSPGQGSTFSVLIPYSKQ